MVIDQVHDLTGLLSLSGSVGFYIGQFSGRFADVLRRDPFSYCGRAGGTVDHIEPRRGRKKFDRPASNLTGACQPCNVAKADQSLLAYLLERVNSGERVRA
jgi:HNH endonuclease